MGEILDKCCNIVSACVNKNIRIALDSLSNRIGISKIVNDIKMFRYKSHYWQVVKREMADAISDCIIKYKESCIGNRRIEGIYIADLTGGEHSYNQGYGGKDLDIIIHVEGCYDKVAKRQFESNVEYCIENTISIILNEYFGCDPKKLLDIPNLIEIHVVSGKDDIPYYNMIKARSRSLIRLM